jgi:hypothetical protein
MMHLITPDHYGTFAREIAEPARGHGSRCGLAMLISRISRRISNGTAGRPLRGRDFQRQYNLKPARCQRITVSGFTIVSA